MNVSDIHLYSLLDNDGTPYKHLELALVDPKPTDSYIIKAVSGLDLTDITPRFYSMAENSDVKYYNMVPAGPRLVSFLISLNPQYHFGESPSSLRAVLHKMIAFSRRGEIEIRFVENGVAKASLFGLVTKFESSLFTSQNEVQLTISCEYPFLQATENTSFVPTVVASPQWENLLSTAPHGFQFSFTATASLPVPYTIQGVFGETFAPFVINYALLSGDTLYFSSEDRDKYLYRTRSSVDLNIADTITAASIWPIMLPGTTRIELPNANVTWNYIRYRPTYWGI